MRLCWYQPSLKSIPSLLSYFLLPHSLSSVLAFTIVAPLFFSSPIYFYSIKMKEKYEKEITKERPCPRFLVSTFCNYLSCLLPNSLIKVSHFSFLTPLNSSSSSSFTVYTNSPQSQCFSIPPYNFLIKGGLMLLNAPISLISIA